VRTINLLGELGTAAKPVAPLIHSALLQRPASVRAEAEKALKAIDPALLATTIEQLNRDLPSTVSQLAEIVKTLDGSRIRNALVALEVIGPQAAPAVPALMEWLGPVEDLSFSKSSNSTVIADSKARLSQDRLREKAAIWKPWIAQVLGEIGPDARAAV